MDAYPEPSPHFPHPDLLEIRKKQIKDLKEVLSELDSSIKLVCVCGNHDVGDIPTVESIEIYKKDFGEDYFSFWHSGCKFIALNSQIYFNSSKIPELRLDQDKWLEDELEVSVAENPKHLVLFQHIPLFIENSDEPDQYFNIQIDQRKNLIQRFKKAGIKKVFCGHYHKNAGGFDGDLECIVTSAIGAQLGKDKHGYRLVEVNENEIKHEYFSVTDEVN